MMQATTERVKVAEAVLGDVAVEFHDDGSAVVTAAMTLECYRCGALHDLEGEPVAFTPDLAWHLAQALRQHMAPDAYRRVRQTIQAAIEGA